MLAIFCLACFLAALSFEHLNNCHEWDLLHIVDHFKLQVPTPVLKSDLKALVVAKLMEAGLIQAPDLPEDSIVPSQAALFQEDHKDGHSVDGEVDEWGKTAYTLPSYDPLSSRTSKGQDGAWLKVLLCLHLEAEENGQARRAQLELEIRWLEIEADKAVKLRKLEMESQPLLTLWVLPPCLLQHLMSAA